MANHASALKAHRQSIQRRSRNKSNRSLLRTGLKKFTEAIKEGKVEEAKASVSSMYALVDKAVQKKVLSKNAAARRKSRLTRRLNVSGAAASTE